MNYILQEVEKEKDPLQKIILARRLLTNFNDPYTNTIPRGGHNPWTLKDQNISKLLEEEERFFTELQTIFGEEAPPLLAELYSRFKRNSNQTRKLASLYSSEKVDFPPHELFPYFEDFNGVVHRQTRILGKKWIDRGFSTQDVVFNPEMIGRGAYGTVYRATRPDAPDLALKLFEESIFLRKRVWIDIHPRKQIEEMLANLSVHAQTIVEFEGFVTPRYISCEGLVHITDFFEGKNLSDIIQEDESSKNDKELLGRAFSAYAEALQYLHSRDLVLVDISPNNILIGTHEEKLCDYDSVCSKEDQTDISLARTVATYPVRESLLRKLRTQIGDLEGFAAMIHHIVTGDYALSPSEGKTPKDVKSAWMRAAKLNQRTYMPPEEMPENMREVLVPVLSYPQNDSLTAKDFREAILLDYGI